MSKPNSKKQFIAESTKCNSDNNRRPSVFERLGTKPNYASSSVNTTPSSLSLASSSQNLYDYCRNWASNGICSYGKNCKYANTHTLTSPSKRSKKGNVTTNSMHLEDSFKHLGSKVIKKPVPHPGLDLNLEEWNQNDLEYEDEKVLERRRQLLQRELELQLRKDKEVLSKDKKIPLRYQQKKGMSTSSSVTSSSSTSSSSSTNGDTSSSTSSDSPKKVKRYNKRSSCSDENDDEGSKDRKRKLAAKGYRPQILKLPPKKQRPGDLPPQKDLISTRKLDHSKNISSRAKPTGLAIISKSEGRRSESLNRSKLKGGLKNKCNINLNAREVDESTKSKDFSHRRPPMDSKKDFDKCSRSALPFDEKITRSDDRGNSKCDKDGARRSRSPIDSKSKNFGSGKDALLKSKKSRTPERLSRSWQQNSRSLQDSTGRNSRRDIDIGRRERSDTYSKSNSNICSKDRNDSRNKYGHKAYSSSIDRNRPRSREHRDKSRASRDDRSYSRFGGAVREHQREKDDSCDNKSNRLLKERGDSLTSSCLDKSSVSSRFKNSRVIVRGGDRDNKDRKSLDYDRNDLPPPRLDRNKSVSRERYRNTEKFPAGVDKSRVLEHERGARAGRFESGRAAYVNHGESDRGSKEVHSIKFEKITDRGSSSKESPRLRNVILEDGRNLHRSEIGSSGYSRLPPPPSEHWEQHDEHLIRHHNYRDHQVTEDERRKVIEPRRFKKNSAFTDSRLNINDRNTSRYVMQLERPFENIHHPMYGDDPIRPVGIRDKIGTKGWRMSQEVELGVRDSPFSPNEWKEKEWRDSSLWDREGLPHSQNFGEEWPSRFDASGMNWKDHSRKWENSKQMRVSIKRKFNSSEASNHAAKKALHTIMKEEPINKKLMELAEGKLRKSTEKSEDSSRNQTSAYKPPPPPTEPTEREVRKPADSTTQPAQLESEPVVNEEIDVKEVEATEVLQEGDLSDISDDADEILDMVDAEPQKKPLEAGSEISDTPNSTLKTSETLEESLFLAENEETLGSCKNNEEGDDSETMDFEEISDGELEEDIKTSCKGLGDALGVDWESLVKESLPRRPSNHENAQNRWHFKSIIQRIGISVKAAGREFVDKMLEKYSNDESEKLLLSDIAFVHAALFRKKVKENFNKELGTDSNLYRNVYMHSQENPDVLKPRTSFYQEALSLLQQKI